LFELTPASYIRFADCQHEDFEQVLHRPIETARLLGMWLFESGKPILHDRFSVGCASVQFPVTPFGVSFLTVVNRFVLAGELPIGEFGGNLIGGFYKPSRREEI
jgi:hypothetical protein